MAKVGKCGPTTRSRPTLDRTLLSLPLQSAAVKRGSARPVRLRGSHRLWLASCLTAYLEQGAIIAP